MKIITVWVTYTTVDEYGRRGSLIGVFKTKIEADKAAEGRGWYGGCGRVDERKAIVDGGRAEDKVYLLDEDHPSLIPLGLDLIEEKKELKKKALAKLSDEEKKLLGIINEE